MAFQKKWVIGGACSALLLIVLLSGILFSALLHYKMAGLLKDFGFQNASLSRPFFRGSDVFFSNIKLDSDGFSQIGSVRIHGKAQGNILGRSFKNITIEEIKQWSQDNMAKWKSPRLIEVVRKMPVSMTGKVQRRELQEKDKALAQTQQDLNDLEDQLVAMKKEIKRLKKDPELNQSKNSDIDNDIRDVQLKFRDIHNFLLENLRDSDRINTHLRDLSENKVF